MLKSRFGIKEIMESRAAVICLGAVCSLASLAAVSAISSFFILMSENPSDLIGIGSLISILVSAAISGFGLSRISGKDGFGASVISHGVSAVVFVIISALCGGLGAAALMNALSFFGVGALAAFLGKNRTKTHKRIKLRK